MTTPSLKSLALAALEEGDEWEMGAQSAAWRELRTAATPERILQYRDEVLEEAAKYLDDIGEDDSAHVIRSLKSKEPTYSGMKNEHGK